MFVLQATSLGLVRRRVGVTAAERVASFALWAKQGAEKTETQQQQPLASSTTSAAIGEAPPAPFQPKQRASKQSPAQTPRSSSSFTPPDELCGVDETKKSETVPTASRSPDIIAASVPSEGTVAAGPPLPLVQSPENDDSVEFYNMTQFFNEDNKLPYPKALSPTAIMEFERCPQSYFFKYILSLPQPRNAALAKGTMAHAALEQFLAIPEKDRNLAVLHNFFRKAWSEHRNEKGYKELFADVAEEIAWGNSGLQLLSNYYDNEPLVQAPNPVQRERWLRVKLGPEQILVRGVIDRLDLVKEQGQTASRIVDYKTGCAPNLKYSPAMNDKIRREAFDQLLIYALLLRRSYSKGAPIRFLRVLYLQSVDDGPAVAWDYDMGTTTTMVDAQLDAMEERILNVYRAIIDKLDSPDPLHAFAGCERSFCFCHQCRSKFAKGLVWEPPSSEP